MNSKSKTHKHPHESSLKLNETKTQLEQLKFEFSRIAIISVHGDPGNLTTTLKNRILVLNAKFYCNSC